MSKAGIFDSTLHVSKIEVEYSEGKFVKVGNSTFAWNFRWNLHPLEIEFAWNFREKKLEIPLCMLAR